MRFGWRRDDAVVHQGAAEVPASAHRPGRAARARVAASAADGVAGHRNSSLVVISLFENRILRQISTHARVAMPITLKMPKTGAPRSHKPSEASASAVYRQVRRRTACQWTQRICARTVTFLGRAAMESNASTRRWRAAHLRLSSARRVVARDLRIALWAPRPGFRPRSRANVYDVVRARVEFPVLMTARNRGVAASSWAPWVPWRGDDEALVVARFVAGLVQGYVRRGPAHRSAPTLISRASARRRRPRGFLRRRAAFESLACSSRSGHGSRSTTGSRGRPAVEPVSARRTGRAFPSSD